VREASGLGPHVTGEIARMPRPERNRKQAGKLRK
jgi:hypothetical protein